MNFDRKEKTGYRRMDVDKDGMVISNEGKVKKKEKNGKKKHKEGGYKDPVVLDVDKRHIENQKKRKRKEEKKDRTELEMANKKKKDNEEEEQNDLVDVNDEMDAIEADDQEKKKKKKKKERKTKDGISTVEEEQSKTTKEKKNKKTIDNNLGTVTETLEGKQKKKQLDTDGVAGKANSKGETEKGKKKKKDNVVHNETQLENNEEDNKGEKKKKKEKEKKIKDDVNSSKLEKPKSKKVTFSDKLKVFPPPNDGETSSAQKGADGYVRGKRYTPEEDEAIKNAIFQYIEDHKLGEKGVEMVLNCSKHKELRNCWNKIRKALPHRPYESFYLRAHTVLERDSVRRWTKEELDLVKQYHEKHGSNWALIAKEMGKFRHHVKEAWRRNRLENMNKGHWSQKEYQKMFELVNQDLQMKVLEEKKKRHSMLRDNIGWEAISTKMETRAFAACCNKWYHELTSPMVAQGIWDDADDYRLLMALVDLDASCEDEVDWDFLLEHRPGDVCRARWNQMWNHLGEHGNKSWAEQVDVLSKRYCPDLVEIREQVDKQREWVNL